MASCGLGYLKNTASRGLVLGDFLNLNFETELEHRKDNGYTGTHEMYISTAKHFSETRRLISK